MDCATKDAALRNKGVGGCARWLMGYGKLQGKKCDLHISTFLHFYTAKNKNDSPPFYTFLHVLHG